MVPGLLSIGPSGTNFDDIWSKYETFHSRKCISKYRLRKSGHFVHGEMGWNDIVIDGSNPSQSLQWRHNGRDSVSNYQPRDCLLNRLFRRRSKKTSKLRVTGLCAGNSLGTGEFSTQMASNAENVSIWWRHHDIHNPIVLYRTRQYHYRALCF